MENKQIDKGCKKCNELFEAAKPLMKLLNEKYHPHCTIIVTQTNAQIFEGLVSTGYTEEFLVD